MANETTLILYYRKTGKFALNAIAGALETSALQLVSDIIFANSLTTLLAAISEAKRQNKRVVVGWSFYSPQFTEIRDTLTEVHNAANDVVHLAGGVHASAEPQQTLAAGFDYVAVGEGERAIIEFLNALSSDQDPAKVRGIASQQNGRFVTNGRGEFIDLNDYPPFSVQYRKFGPIEITRGCVFGCKFCQTPFMNKAKFRHRSIANIRHYVEILKAAGFRDYRFITPTSLSYGAHDETVNLAAVEELLASVRELIGPQNRLFYGTFPSEVRPEHATPKALKILKKYVDNDNLIIGGQSGSQAILDSSHRGHNVAATTNAVKLTIAAGFRPNVDFLFGLPGETAADAKATLQLAQALADMGARIHSHTFMPFPGTPYKNQAPGVLPQEIEQGLMNLAAKGDGYGQWRTQQRIANQLATLRTTTENA